MLGYQTVMEISNTYSPTPAYTHKYEILDRDQTHSKSRGKMEKKIQSLQRFKNDILITVGYLML